MKGIHLNMTKPIDYHIEGLVPELLKQSNYQWFATGRFGLDKLLGNPLNRVDVFSIYVPKEQLKDWESYLKEKGKKVVVVCTRTRMSKELEAVADKFIPAETLKSFLYYTKNNTPTF